jgi:hypothetical protein
MSENGLAGFPALNTEMRCGIVTNGKGDILIVHDKEMRSDIQWIEYDEDTETLFLIHEDGLPQDLGIKLTPKLKSNLSHGVDVVLAQIRDKQIVHSQLVSILLQKY